MATIRPLVIRFQSESESLIADIQRIQRGTEEYKAGLQSLAITAGATTAAISLFAKSAIDTGIKFEALKTQLKTTLGSEGAAKSAFETIQEFAQTTPFQVDAVTQAFLSLKNRGIDPSLENLRKAGDIASSQSKPLQQFVEAILDATSGENERLNFLSL